MSAIDFSNAVIQPSDYNTNAFASSYLNLYNMSIRDASNNNIATATYRITYSGNVTTVTYSGFIPDDRVPAPPWTEIYLGDGSNFYWRISNITAYKGDTFSFAIDVTTTTR